MDSVQELAEPCAKSQSIFNVRQVSHVRENIHACARDPLGQFLSSSRRINQVEFSNQHQARRLDLSQPGSGIMLSSRLDLPVKCIDLLGPGVSLREPNQAFNL